MLNFNRRDRPIETPDAAKTVLKPAIYEPPGSANVGGGGTRPPVAHAPGAGDAAAPPRASTAPAPAPAAAARPAPGDAPESRLFVGPNIKLKGVEITDCDALVIEGHVEATVHSKAMEIAKPGTLTGNAQIDVAEVHGEFVGELTARTRLTVHGTGRVRGTIRYGSLIVAEGGEVTGDVKRIDANDAPIAISPGASTAAATPARTPLSPSAEKWSN